MVNSSEWTRDHVVHAHAHIRRRKYIIREKLSHLLSTPKNRFLKNLNLTISGGTTSVSSTVDGCSDPSSIAEVFKTNLSSLLNSNRNVDPNNDATLTDYKGNVTEDDLSSISISPSVVNEAFSHLKPNKSDGTGVPSNVLLFASPVVTEFYSQLFTAILRQGYMHTDGRVLNA